MEDAIGIVAGKVWHYLAEHNETDAIQIKLSLNIDNTQIFLALGWLARENKIIIWQDKNLYRVKLKEQK